MADARKDDVGSPFYSVPHKGRVLCGLCSPVGIRMERVACWAGFGLGTPYENLSGPWCGASCFHPRNILGPAEVLFLVHLGRPGYTLETVSPLPL